ncbi:hypothetical protein ACQJBY_056182 [Aegilops geniculata]
MTCSTSDLTAILRVRWYQTTSLEWFLRSYTARSMRRGTATAWWLLVAVAALLVSCAASARPPPVLRRGGGDAGLGGEGAGGHGSCEAVLSRGGGDAGLGGGRELEAMGAARRLGQRTPVNKPPSPNPHGASSMAVPPPPSITS